MDSQAWEFEQLKKENLELRQQHEIDKLRIQELRRKIRAKDDRNLSQSFGGISCMVNQQELTISRLLKIKQANEEVFEEMEAIHETDTISHKLHIENLEDRISSLTSTLKAYEAELRMKSEKNSDVNATTLEDAHRANSRLIYENSRLKSLLEQNFSVPDFDKYLHDERIIRQEQIANLELSLLEQKAVEESLRAQLEREREESATQIRNLQAKLAMCKAKSTLVQTKGIIGDEVSILRRNQKKLIRLVKYQVQEIEDLRSQMTKG